jgi:hypothetical protein
MTDAYEPRFDIDNRRGKIGENLVNTFVQAIGNGTIEVKTDSRVLETGNVYVEIMQVNQKGAWVASGLKISEADFYCFAGESGVGFVAIRTDVLKDIAGASQLITKRDEGPQARPTQGRLVKVKDLLATIFKAAQNG